MYDPETGLWEKMDGEIVDPDPCETCKDVDELTISYEVYHEDEKWDRREK